jgi:hypothetical protein
MVAIGGHSQGHRGAPVSCSICDVRREKRFCLAVHDRICPQCCGEQREVTLDCPSECPYLQQARQHEKPRNFDDMPVDEVFPRIDIREDFVEQHRPLIAGVLQTLGRISRADRNLNDRDIIGGMAKMAASYQTLVGSGLLYQEPVASPAQLKLIEQLRRLLEEFREVEQRHLGRTTLRDADIMLMLVFTLRLAHLHTSGRPRSRGFIDFLQQQFPEVPASADAAAVPGGRIIMP